MNNINPIRRDFLKILGMGIATITLPGCSKAIAQKGSGYRGKKYIELLE